MVVLIEKNDDSPMDLGVAYFRSNQYEWQDEDPQKQENYATLALIHRHLVDKNVVDLLFTLVSRYLQ